MNNLTDPALPNPHAGTCRSTCLRSEGAHESESRRHCVRVEHLDGIQRIFGRVLTQGEFLENIIGRGDDVATVCDALEDVQQLPRTRPNELGVLGPLGAFPPRQSLLVPGRGTVTESRWVSANRPAKTDTLAAAPPAMASATARTIQSNNCGNIKVECASCAC